VYIKRCPCRTIDHFTWCSDRDSSVSYCKRFVRHRLPLWRETRVSLTKIWHFSLG